MVDKDELIKDIKGHLTLGKHIQSFILTRDQLEKLIEEITYWKEYALELEKDHG